MQYIRHFYSLLTHILLTELLIFTFSFYTYLMRDIYGESIKVTLPIITKLIHVHSYTWPMAHKRMSSMLIRTTNDRSSNNKQKCEEL